MKVKVRIPAPHSDIQRQLFYCLTKDYGPQFTIVNCGTKFGKTFAAGAAITMAMTSRRHNIGRWVAPIYRQSVMGYQRYIKKLMPGAPFSEFTKSTMSLHVPSLDNELQFWHGQNPEDLEGEGVHFFVLDEAAKSKPQVWESTLTTLTFTKGKGLIISTPRGKNWFYKLAQKAKAEMSKANYEDRTPRMMYLTAPTTLNPYVDPQTIEDWKNQLPDRLYRQYILAEFVDDGEVFMGLDLCIDSEMHEFDNPHELWVHPDHEEIEVTGGIDWAKRGDYTVATAWDYTQKPFRMVGFIRFQGVNYTEAIVRVAKFYKRFKSVEMVWHDRTGVGDAISELLAGIPDFPYKDIVFTNSTKNQMVNSYMTAIENQEVILPNWKELKTEHEVYEVKTSETSIRYSAPDGMHDDIVTACFLGHSCTKEHGDTEYNIRILEDLPYQKDPLTSWYDDHADFDLEEGF